MVVKSKPGGAGGSIGAAGSTSKHKNSQAASCRTFVRHPDEAVFDIGKERNKGN